MKGVWDPKKKKYVKKKKRKLNWVHKNNYHVVKSSLFPWGRKKVVPVNNEPYRKPKEDKDE